MGRPAVSLHSVNLAPEDESRQGYEPPPSSANSYPRKLPEALLRRAKKLMHLAVVTCSSLGREAQILGVTKSRYAKIVDEDDAAALHLAHVLGSSSDVRRAVALALLSLAEVDELDTPIEQQVLALGESCGQLQGSTRRAFADGVYTRAELEGMKKDALTCAEDAAAILVQIDRALGLPGLKEKP